jgi:predicted nucleic acid-binding protein
VSCRERGVTLVTANERDFARIRRFVAGFNFVTNFP